MDVVFLFFVGLLGLIVGSFINCLVWRLHSHESILGRSYCPHCRHTIRWYDNIPLFSFLNLNGRCRHCKKKISWRYPIVEAITALLFILVFIKGIVVGGSMEIWTYLTWLTVVRDLVFVSALIVVFISDVLWYIIFDEVALPAAIIVGVINLILGVSWQNLLLSATIGSGFFLIQYLASRGRWIGGGDIRLGLLLGLGLGWPLILPAIFIAYLLGACVGLGLLFLRKREWKSALPLGTFLAISGTLVLFVGPEIINWYLGLLYR